VLMSARNAATISMTPPFIVGVTIGVALFPEFFVRSGKLFRGNRLGNLFGPRGSGAGAPRPTRMGTIAWPWRNDTAACHALLVGKVATPRDLTVSLSHPAWNER